MAATTPNMGLKVWNLLTDSYDHAQLAENFAKVDQHRHTEGQGSQIPTGGLENGAVSAAKIGSEQVSPEKLTSAVTESVGINTPSRTYRQVVSTEATYTNSTTSYTLVDTATVYVPTNGRLMISYFTLQKASTSVASIACFIDEVEVKKIGTNGVPTAYTSPELATASFFGFIQTTASGSAAFLEKTTGATADTALNATGMGAAPTQTIFGLTAGTHKVEIKSKAGAAGKIELKNRFLWVKSEGYS